MSTSAGADGIGPENPQEFLETLWPSKGYGLTYHTLTTGACYSPAVPPWYDLECNYSSVILAVFGVARATACRCVHLAAAHLGVGRGCSGHDIVGRGVVGGTKEWGLWTAVIRQKLSQR